MYYTNVYTAPVFDSSMGACSWQTSKAAECRAEIEALEGDFHLVGRLAMGKRRRWCLHRGYRSDSSGRTCSACHCVA